MHKGVQEFLFSVSLLYPQYFNDAKVLDMGSLDINGNNRWVLKNCKYLGVDVATGNNVDSISLAHEFRTSQKFDLVLSTEMLEHDKYYKETLKNAISLLRSNGMLCFTCATTGRHVHGIERERPEDNPKLFRTNYYRNITQEDVENAIDMDLFSSYNFKEDKIHCDLYFWGILK